EPQLVVYGVTFFASEAILVWGVFILPFAAQIAGVDCHCGLDLLLGQFHALIEDLKELL
uniref:Uncharacterized protein n=1 Tax=Denticeps clupeoides TaxID=299321 RepID=A0AAY4EJI0_9TELE